MSSESLPEQKVILASNSSIRKKILEDSGISFEVVPSEVEEEELKQSLSSNNFKEYCLTLAKAKALDVSIKKNNAYVIGSDQICCYEDEIFSKPLTKENCFKTLSKLSGNTHYQNCGISICKDGKEVWSHYAQAALTMKSLTDSEIKDYIDKDCLSSSSSTSEGTTSKEIPESSKIFFLIEEFDARITFCSGNDSELKIGWS